MDHGLGRLIDVRPGHHGKHRENFHESSGGGVEDGNTMVVESLGLPEATSAITLMAMSSAVSSGG